jgi:hypothetical protein
MTPPCSGPIARPDGRLLLTVRWPVLGRSVCPGTGRATPPGPVPHAACAGSITTLGHDFAFRKRASGASGVGDLAGRYHKPAACHVGRRDVQRAMPAGTGATFPRIRRPRSNCLLCQQLWRRRTENGGFWRVKTGVQPCGGGCKAAAGRGSLSMAPTALTYTYLHAERLGASCQRPGCRRAPPTIAVVRLTTSCACPGWWRTRTATAGRRHSITNHHNLVNLGTRLRRVLTQRAGYDATDTRKLTQPSEQSTIL